MKKLSLQNQEEVKEERSKFFHWFAQIKPYAILTLIPLFFTLLFGGAFSPVSNTDVPVLIYDMDGSNESRQLVNYFVEYPYLNISETVSSMAQIEEAMLSGEALGAVIVPDGFGADLQSRSGAEVLVMQDSSNFMNMSTIMQAASNISGTMNAGIRLKLLQAGGMLPEQAAKNVLSLSVVDRGLYNPTYGYLYFLFPGLLAVFVQQTLLATATPYLIEKKQLLCSGPGWRRAFAEVAARLGSFALAGTLGLFICLLTLSKVFNYPVNGSAGLILLVHVPFVLAVCGMGMLISAVFDDTADCTMFNMFLTIPTFLSCGYAWPEYMMPETFKAVATHIWPLYYYANPLRDIIMKDADYAIVAPFAEGCLWFAAFWLPAGILAYVYKVRLLRRIENN